MEKFWIFLSFVMVFIGLMLIIIIGLVGGEDRTEADVAVGGFVGPVPFGFASSPGMLKFLIVMLAVMFAIVILPILMKYPK